MELRERLKEIHRGIDDFAAQAARERQERLRGLQLAARALRQAESTAQWVQILADAAAPLAESICFFRVDGLKLLCEAARGMDLIPGEIELADAPAFRQVVESKETVVSLFAPGQLSAAVAGSAATQRRAYLYPLAGKTRVLGLMLAADDNGPDGYALEVLLSLAAAALELRETRSSTLVGVAAPAAVVRPATAASFARSTVARWILENGERIARGRARRDLYAALRGPIDDARALFRSRYPEARDCLHAEILGRLALGDAAMLGASYPGPLRGGDRA